MSDFPPIEEFSSTTTNTDLDSDPTADFLAREAAVLGEEAALFAAPSLPPNSSITVVNDSSVPELEAFPEITPSNLGTQDFTSAPLAPDYSAFHSEFPPVADSTGEIPFNTSTAAFTEKEPEPEPEVLREWRERQLEIVAQRDEAAEIKKKQTIEQAHADIDKFYEEYSRKKVATLQKNRRDQELFIQERDDITSGTSWERICKILNLVSVQSKSTEKHERDITRFRELLLDLKKDEKAPGSAGY